MDDKDKDKDAAGFLAWVAMELEASDEDVSVGDAVVAWRMMRKAMGASRDVLRPSEFLTLLRLKNYPVTRIRGVAGAGFILGYSLKKQPPWTSARPWVRVPSAPPGPAVLEDYAKRDADAVASLYAMMPPLSEDAVRKLIGEWKTKEGEGK